MARREDRGNLYANILAMACPYFCPLERFAVRTGVESTP
jgi:hypothetical protein